MTAIYDGKEAGERWWAGVRQKKEKTCAFPRMDELNQLQKFYAFLLCKSSRSLLILSHPMRVPSFHFGEREHSGKGW